jgi:peptide/nickel transport system substrate-binding protein
MTHRDHTRRHTPSCSPKYDAARFVSNAIRRALIIMLASCALTVSAQDLRIGMGADVTSIDPHFVNLFPNNNIAEHIFEKLTTVDADSRLIPALAESWKAIEPTTWEFKLRKGVKFHDGSDFTAEDVAFSIDRVGKIPGSTGPFTTYTKAIKEVQIVDSHTIRFKTAAPHPQLPNDLCTIYLVSKKAATGASTADFEAGKGMIGTGPFRFVSFKRGDRVEMARNDNYWGPKPAWAKVTFRVVPSDPSRVAALLAGDLDAIENIPTADFTKIKANTNLQVATKTSHRIIFYHVDQFRDPSPFVFDKAGKQLAKNPLKDVRVRQAISKAIDRNAIKDRLMEGLALPSSNLVPTPMFGHVAALKPDTYDPNAAKKLLADAGYPNGFALTIHGPNNRYVNDDQIMQTVAQMLTRIGIQTKVETMPMNVYLSRARKLEFSFAMLGWGASTAEATSPLRAHLVSYVPEKGWGEFAWGRYANEKVNDLLDKALATIDDKQREKMVQDAVTIAMKELGIIPIHHQINTWAMKKGISYTPRVDEYTLAFQFRPQP